MLRFRGKRDDVNSAYHKTIELALKCTNLYELNHQVQVDNEEVDYKIFNIAYSPR